MQIKSYDEMEYHPVTEKILTILRNKTMNTESDLYFRILGSFFVSQMASNMRTNIVTEHRGTLPTNMFACCLATSGAGKGFSLNILEDQLVSGFKKNFLDVTFPTIAEKHVELESARKANLNSTDYEEELEKLTKEFDSYGAFPYVFDSGTGPAYKQVRTKAQIGKVGALTMVADEIGTNLLNNQELFAVNLEAYDVGKIKQKITKNTNESKRGEERDDPVPSNMLIFGTPSKLFNGAKEENEFYALLDTGYARRLFFGIGTKNTPEFVDAETVYEQLTAHDTDQDVSQLHHLFSNLANPANYNLNIELPKSVALINIQYQLDCEQKANGLSDYEAIRKAELQHRYFKALKLAGALAFIDSSLVITEEHMYAAIKLTEDSGNAFEKILTRDKAYARLAKYICACKKEVTHADICEDLPFYPTTKSKQEELLTLAVAWGYKNNVVIKRSYENSIEFFKGEALQETTLDKLTVSYSEHMAYNYFNKEIRFDQLEKLTQSQGIHWINHAVMEGHRQEDSICAGFNLLVIDCDGGISLNTAQMLLQGYQAAFYTTKRHTDENHRFRIILPLKYILKLSAKDYKEFMANIFEWLPFPSDEGTDQRSKKWLSHKGTFVSQEGELLDPLPFIPRTQKNIERKEKDRDLGDIPRIEKYFAGQWETEGRNNTLIRYGLMLKDSGIDLHEVEQRVKSFNERFSNPLTESEINATIMRTLSK